MTSRFDQISWICTVQSAICMNSGGSSGNSTSSTSPWAGQQSYLSDIFSSAEDQYQNYTPQYDPSSTVAGMNSGETNAIDATEGLGTNGSSALNSANSALTNYANGDMLNPSTNPGLASVEAQTAASVTPNLMSAFTQGTTDNPNVALAASNGVANAVGNIAYQNYGTQTGNQLAAAEAAPNLFNAQLGGTNAAFTAGQDAQTQSQNELTDQVNRYNYGQQLPYTKINQFANLVNGQYGSTTNSSSPSQSLLGSLFSDRKLKENIKRIGVADNGLAIYAYNFKSDKYKKTHIGFMADEVEKLHPSAIHENHEHIKLVNYALAVLPAGAI